MSVHWRYPLAMVVIVMLFLFLVCIPKKVVLHVVIIFPKPPSKEHSVVFSLNWNSESEQCYYC